MTIDESLHILSPVLSIEAADLNLLVTLQHVLEEGSVTKAARRLNVTPSAVSNALARLRDMLGDPLFVRRGRGIVATPRALALKPRLDAALDSLRSIVEAGGGFDPSTCTRRFALASADNIGAGNLPAIVRAFAERLPSATLQIVTLDHAISSDGLSTGAIDVLLGVPPPSPEQRSEAVYEEELVVAVWTENPRVPRRLGLARFVELEHIAVEVNGRHRIDLVDAALSRRDLRRRVVVSVPQFSVAAACVVGTHYATMLPAAMAKQVARMLPLRLLRAPIELPRVPILQVWHQRTDADPGSRFFRGVLRDALAPR